MKKKIGYLPYLILLFFIKMGFCIPLYPNTGKIFSIKIGVQGNVLSYIGNPIGLGNIELYKLRYDNIGIYYLQLDLLNLYRKIYAKGFDSKSKKVFTLNKYNYYSLSLDEIVLGYNLIRFLLGRDSSLDTKIPPVEFGWFKSKEYYSARLKLKDCFTDYQDVYCYDTYYYNNGDLIPLYQSNTYSVLNFFEKNVYFIHIPGIKFGYAEYAATLPITWFNNYEDKAIVVREKIKAKGLYISLYGLEYESNKAFYMEFYWFMPFKTKYKKLEGYSLSYDTNNTDNDLNLEVLGFNFDWIFKIQKHIGLNIEWNPELWLVQFTPPWGIYDIFMSIANPGKASDSFINRIRVYLSFDF